jgi:hypothetical protein
MVGYADAIRVASRYTQLDLERKSLAVLHTFLIQNPDLFGWRGKTKPNLSTEQGLTTLAEKYFTSRRTLVSPSEPQTVPDDMVSVILNSFYGHHTSRLDSIKKEHQHSMAAENMVGELLERYLDSVLKNYGWIWCCGALVKHIDFIKQSATGGFQLLQIKNRDNSENSSSKAIRDGTDIQHWFRTFSRTGATNWGAFPDAVARSQLSESGFIRFVQQYPR